MPAFRGTIVNWVSRMVPALQSPRTERWGGRNRHGGTPRQPRPAGPPCPDRDLPRVRRVSGFRPDDDTRKFMAGPALSGPPSNYSNSIPPRNMPITVLRAGLRGGSPLAGVAAALKQASPANVSGSSGVGSPSWNDGCQSFKAARAHIVARGA